MAAPYPCTGSLTSRARVVATSSLVPAAALLLMTMISSIRPVASNSSMAARMASRSL
jgi:hypothetical protein